MSEAYVVVRDYGYSGYAVSSIWLNPEEAVKERDFLNAGELPDEEEGWEFGDQTCLNFRIYKFPLNRRGKP